jgi:hypothetical protein
MGGIEYDDMTLEQRSVDMLDQQIQLPFTAPHAYPFGQQHELDRPRSGTRSVLAKPHVS